MIGALIGFLLLLLDPLARAAVLLLAIRGRYPWWLITPDDPVSPFGLYEPAMRRHYGLEAGVDVPRGWRRYWGDVCWLAGRNVLYGLTYKFKSQRLMPKLNGLPFLNYKHLSGEVKVLTSWARVYSVAGFSMLSLRFFPWRGRVYGAYLGWKIDSIIEDPLSPRQQINMEGRPVFSPIRVVSR